MYNIPTLAKRSFHMYILLLFNFAHLIMSIAISSKPNAVPCGCTVSPDWVGSGYDPQDCSAATVQFSNQEVSVFGKKEYEFMGENADRAHRPLISQSLPRQFTVGEWRLSPTQYS